jgi:hydroxymethylpyrimidine pyrophosphatase-like HAD family hydrolase
MIFSGNKISRFKKVQECLTSSGIDYGTVKKVFADFYCNFGNSKYHFNQTASHGYRFVFDGKVFKNISMFSHYFNLVDYLVKNLNKSKVFLNYNNKLDYSNFENCGDVNIAISPLEHREEILPAINDLIDEYNAFYYTDFHAYINGNTTIDILYKDFNKASCLNEIARDLKFNYIGDKLEDGNDASVKTIKLANCISVDDVYDTNFLLRALEYSYE